MAPDHDPKPLNFDYPAADCPFCGGILPCECSAEAMFGEDYAVNERHQRNAFRVNPGAVDWSHLSQDFPPEPGPEDAG